MSFLAARLPAFIPAALGVVLLIFAILWRVGSHDAANARIELAGSHAAHEITRNSLANLQRTIINQNSAIELLSSEGQRKTLEARRAFEAVRDGNDADRALAAALRENTGLLADDRTCATDARILDAEGL